MDLDQQDQGPPTKQLRAQPFPSVGGKSPSLSPLPRHPQPLDRSLTTPRKPKNPSFDHPSPTKPFRTVKEWVAANSKVPAAPLGEGEGGGEKVINLAVSPATTPSTRTSLQKPSYPRFSSESFAPTIRAPGVEDNSDIFTSPRAQKGGKGIFARQLAEVRKKEREEEKAQLPQLAKEVFELLDDDGVELSETVRARLRSVLEVCAKKSEGVVRG